MLTERYEGDLVYFAVIGRRAELRYNAGTWLNNNLAEVVPWRFIFATGAAAHTTSRQASSGGHRVVNCNKVTLLVWRETRGLLRLHGIGRPSVLSGIGHRPKSGALTAICRWVFFSNSIRCRSPFPSPTACCCFRSVRSVTSVDSYTSLNWTGIRPCGWADKPSSVTSDVGPNWIFVLRVHVWRITNRYRLSARGWVMNDVIRVTTKAALTNFCLADFANFLLIFFLRISTDVVVSMACLLK
jgi:hypothetical protein